MTIKIKGKEYTLKSSFRSYILYENISGKSFEPTTMTDIINFFFCVVLTSSKDYDLKYNDFLDILDEHPQYMVEFSNWLSDEYTKSNMLSPEPEEGEEDKKKVTKK